LCECRACLGCCATLFFALLFDVYWHRFDVPDARVRAYRASVDVPLHGCEPSVDWVLRFFYASTLPEFVLLSPSCRRAFLCVARDVVVRALFVFSLGVVRVDASLFQRAGSFVVFSLIFAFWTKKK
jgi:hypothetical protein